MNRERGAFGGPDQLVLLGGARRPCAQHDAVQDRQPDEARQLDHARVGEEFGEVPADRPRRRRGRRAEIDEKDFFQCCESALERSLAVTSTIGTTRSYAMRVGPMTPTVPTTSPSTLYGEVTTLTSSGALTPDSPPMKTCTPWPRSERSRICRSEVLRSKSSRSCFRRPTSCERSRTANRLRSPETTNGSPPSASGLPASGAACMSWLR